jgi:hypothetical protein
VEVEDQRGRERRIRVAGRAGRPRVELVLGAEEQGRPAVARIAAVEPELVVPVGEREPIGRQAQDEAGISDARRPGRRDVGLGDRLTHESAGLKQVDVEIDQVLIAARAVGAAVDDAAGVATVEHGRAARIELDLLDELGMQHARCDQQVVEIRDARAVEQEAGRAGAGAADDREGQQRNDGRRARQGLDHAEGIAEGARDLLDLGAAQGDARDLLAPLVAHDDDLVGVVALALDGVGHHQLLLRGQVLLLEIGVAVRGVHVHARVARGQGQAESGP